MPVRRVTIGLCLAGLITIACEPSPPPSLTPPPPPADAVPWRDLVWRAADLPPRPADVEIERVVAVAARPGGVVAVGYHETGGVRDGAIWYSADSSTWALVGLPALLADVELLDVSSVPEGFVALGIATGGPLGNHTRAVFFRSDDGQAWERLPPEPGAVDTFPTSLASGDRGVLATGDAADGGPAAWLSADERTFERITTTGAAGGINDPHAVADGFVALGADLEPPVLLRSTDGVAWTSTPIDPAPEVTAHRLIIGRWGYMAQGILASGCGTLGSCPAPPIAWWSSDGGTWGRLPLDGSPTTNGGSIIVTAAEHGFLAIDGASAWASADGWAWTGLPEPGDGSIVVNDAVVRVDLIVAVGQEDLDDGTSEGRILVGLGSTPFSVLDQAAERRASVLGGLDR